jgi:hypothetical protein
MAVVRKFSLAFTSVMITNEPSELQLGNRSVKFLHEDIINVPTYF